VGARRRRLIDGIVDAVLTALAEQHAELAGLLADLDERDWRRTSRCEDWSVADVILHLAQTDELAIASARGRFPEAVVALSEGLGRAESVDDGADAMVTRERGEGGPAVRARWEQSATMLREALAATDPHARVVWVAGELSARTLATTRLAESWIHTGDVAAPFGVDPRPTDRLWHVARLAWRTLPYAFARCGRELAGPVALHLVSPSGSAWDFVPDTEPLTVISGGAVGLCLVAARRTEPRETDLVGEGPDAVAALELIRTYA
jgi:uncharacterized protein (TIGR03084 family)